MTSSDTYQLKWHSHSSHLNGSVAALLRSERFTDVVLCTMDGSQIPAHKFILSSCSVYLSNLFEGQRSVTRMGGMLYVVLPSEISTRALKILVEYMYKGETTVSNEVLDVVLKAGEVLKIRGLWRQPDEAGGDSVLAEKQPQASTTVNKPAKSPDENVQLAGPQKIAIKKNLGLKAFTPVQGTQGGAVTRPMFIGPPKLVFIKTSESGQAQIRPAGPKGQTILVAPTPTPDAAVTERQSPDTATPRIIRLNAESSGPSSEQPCYEIEIVKENERQGERKYGKKQKLDSNEDKEKDADDQDTTSTTSTASKKSKPNSAPLLEAEVQIKEEPDWDASSIEEEERSIAEMFQAEMSVKTEPIDEVDIDDEGLMYSPLACELCAEVFTVPAQWVRHVQSHAQEPHTRRVRTRSQSDDTEETMALLRCDLCQKHFPNPAEWVRHIQSTHTETEGTQNKTCGHCKKVFPSHASMLIHTRTHTGERPFVCGLCNKGFNVKSNLLRHLRTLHDQQILSPTVADDDDDDDDDEEVESPKCPPRVKNES